MAITTSQWRSRKVPTKWAYDIVTSASAKFKLSRDCFSPLALIDKCLIWLFFFYSNQDGIGTHKYILTTSIPHCEKSNSSFIVIREWHYGSLEWGLDREGTGIHREGHDTKWLEAFSGLSLFSIRPSLVSLARNGRGRFTFGCGFESVLSHWNLNFCWIDDQINAYELGEFITSSRIWRDFLRHAGALIYSTPLTHMLHAVGINCGLNLAVWIDARHIHSFERPVLSSIPYYVKNCE